jgi:predicted ribosomally synthesized peptide with SipW-like signal peptide
VNKIYLQKIIKLKTLYIYLKFEITSLFVKKYIKLPVDERSMKRGSTSAHCQKEQKGFYYEKTAAKKTLLASAAALSLSALLFAGTTYAWFTDSASSAASTITAGNLKIGLQVWNGTEYVDVTKTVDIFNPSNTQKDLWEPGHVETAYVRISNSGTLSLKYQLNLVAQANIYLNVDGDTTSLSDYIKYGIKTVSEDPSASQESREQAVADLQETSIS